MRDIRAYYASENLPASLAGRLLTVVATMLTTATSVLTIVATLVLTTGCADEVDTDKYFLSDEFLKLGTANLSIEGGGSTQTIAVGANCAWTATASADWLTLSPAQGNGNATITLSAQANSSIAADRNATITVKTAGGLQRTIHVHQAKSNETLTFNASELTFAAGGETKSLVIESNATWEIRGVEEWFTLSQTSGQGNATINITATGNSSENERSAILTVSGATTSGHVTIMQEGRSTNLTASATSLAYEAVGGQQTLRLEGTASWTATASATWLTMDKISGQGTYDLLISCEANTQQSAREATITISYGALSKRQTITVTVSQQAAVLPVLTMPASVTIGRDQMTVSSTVTSPFAVTERGFVWSATNSTPTKSDHSISVTAATAAFEGTISGLDSGTTYYVRAYATSAVGTSYSEVLTISTSGGKPGENDNPIPNI